MRGPPKYGAPPRTWDDGWNRRQRPYPLATVAGFKVGLSVLVPKRQATASRWLAFKQAWRDAGRLYLVIALVLAVQAVCEIFCPWTQFETKKNDTSALVFCLSSRMQQETNWDETYSL